MKIYARYELKPIGTLYAGEENGWLTDLHFEHADFDAAGVEFSSSPLLEEAKKQLEEYFKGKRRVFDLPLKPCGTDFQMRCWSALLDIPYGECRSYADVARAAGSPKAFRAAGGACHRNPIAIIIPCHRVIGTNGSLTGFGGGLGVKQALLELEAGKLNQRYGGCCQK